jgi:hypothetical protein
VQSGAIAQLNVEKPMPRKAPRSTARSSHASATPRPLATPTGLSGLSTRSIANAVNPLIADAFALYVKTKNFHWHLSGPQFRDYHLMFDEQADSIFEDVDEVAERLRMLGETTIRSISHIARLQTMTMPSSPHAKCSNGCFTTTAAWPRRYAPPPACAMTTTIR